MLRKALRAQAGLLELELKQPMFAGLPFKLKEVSRQHQAGVVILLPDYSKALEPHIQNSSGLAKLRFWKGDL